MARPLRVLQRSSNQQVTRLVLVCDVYVQQKCRLVAPLSLNIGLSLQRREDYSAQSLWFMLCNRIYGGEQGHKRPPINLFRLAG